MATIKRTSSGPKIGPAGSTIGAPKNVGTKGNAVENSTTGGQYSFLPSPSAKKGESKGTKMGQSETPRENYYDFMPRKAGGKK